MSGPDEALNEDVGVRIEHQPKKNCENDQPENESERASHRGLAEMVTNLANQGGRGGPACPPPGVATTERTSVALSKECLTVPVFEYPPSVPRGPTSFRHSAVHSKARLDG